MRLGPPPEAPEVPGQFWIDFIRDTAPVFRKSDHRAARRVHRADLAGAHRRRRSTSTPRLREIFDELRPGRDRRGQRRRVPGRARHRAGRGSGSVAATRPSCKDPAVAPVLVGLPDRRSRGWPAFLDEVRPDPRRHVGRLRRVLPRPRRARPRTRPARARLHATSRRTSTCTLPGRGRLRARPAAGADVAPPRLVRPSDRRDLGAAGAAGERPTGALVYLSLGSLGSADVGLMQRLVDVLGGPRTGSSCRRGRWPTRSRSTTT